MNIILFVFLKNNKNKKVKLLLRVYTSWFPWWLKVNRFDLQITSLPQFYSAIMNFGIIVAHFCDKHGPRSILCTERIPSDQINQAVLGDFSKESYCKACLLLLPKNNSTLNTTTLKTKDPDSDDYFVTAQYSAQKFRILNSIVRKCLSEESIIYDSRPMYFGDEGRGYSIALSFKLKDLEARGSERRYSFIVNSDNESLILQNWDLIVQNITAVIHYLKEESIKVELETSQNNDMFLRGKQLQSNSLTAILKDEQLFLKIHLWNAKLLKKLTV